MQFKLIEDARLWWRMWSVRLAAAFAALMAWLTTSPEALLQLVRMVPPEYSWAAPILTFIVTFGIPTFVRLVVQPKLAEKSNAIRP